MRGRVDVVGRDDLVDDAKRQRLVGLDEPSGVDDVLGLARADQARQSLRAAGAGDDAELDLRLADLDVVTGDSPVRGEGKLEAAAERVSGDRGDDRLRDGRDLGQGPGQLGAELRDLGVAARRHLLDVGATGEGLLAAVEDHRADVVAVRRLLRGLREFGRDLGVQRVDRRAIQADRADPVLDLQGYELSHAAHPP